MDLNRFFVPEYYDALSEINIGSKETDWMWFVFPQLKGLGYSEQCKKYEFKNTKEAEYFLNNFELKKRLINAFEAILKHGNLNIFSETDVLKFVSCATLFLNIAKSVNDVYVIELTQRALDLAEKNDVPICKITLNIYNEDKLLEKYYTESGISDDEDDF